MSKVVMAAVRDAGMEWHIECRFDDGQKFAAIAVDKEMDQAEELAARIAHMLNNWTAQEATTTKGESE